MNRVIRHIASRGWKLLLVLLLLGAVPAQADDPEPEGRRTMSDDQVKTITSKERWRYGRKPNWGEVRRRGRAVARKPGDLPSLPGSGSHNGAGKPQQTAPNPNLYTDPNGGGTYGSQDPNGGGSGYYNIDTSQAPASNSYTPPRNYSPSSGGGSSPSYYPPSSSSPSISPSSGGGSSGDWNWGWLKYVLIISAVLLVLWFFMRMRKENQGKRKPKKEKAEEEVEEKEEEEEDIEDLLEQEKIDIHEIEFVDEITLAERAGNYRRAIRLRYLNALRDLSAKGLIMWKINKTNYDYYYELEGKEPIKDRFHGVVRIFEDVWYGQFDLEESHYTDAAETFESFNTALKRA